MLRLVEGKRGHERDHDLEQGAEQQGPLVVMGDAGTGGWLAYSAPQEVIVARRPGQVMPALQRLEEAAGREGLHAAGFISYEAAPAFDPALETMPASGPFPLLWFGLFPPPQPHPPQPPRAGYRLGPWLPATSQEEYLQAIATIKEAIAAGQTYQVNYTLRLEAAFQGEAWPFFLDLVAGQPCRHAAFVDTGRFALCSVSPELFFRLEGEQLTTRPMKGTAPRGLWAAADQAQADWLRHSEKNQAENVMIVDMVRNDLGRVARLGSVQVPALFQVEQYPTLWQMTSTVSAQTERSLAEILAALFPCASITGAPKVRTMQLIRALERRPRHIYTGAIGAFAPGRQAHFNVAIRTVLIDRARQRAEYGVGGGIVWDSDGQEEYEEALLKARVLTARRPPFSLLETMRWTPGEGYFLLDYHLARLEQSARYFQIPLDLDRVRQRLAGLATAMEQPQRVRLLLAQDGQISLESAPLPPEMPASLPLRLGLAPAPIDRQEPFLYHKTTYRPHYEAARAACPACDDVLLWNERGEITEATMANVVVEWEGSYLTPPQSCGLIAGTYRAQLLDQQFIEEEVITLEMLARCRHIYLINSVRQWQEAVLATPLPQNWGSSALPKNAQGRSPNLSHNDSQEIP